jgi:hypothetical protein
VTLRNGTSMARLRAYGRNLPHGISIMSSNFAVDDRPRSMRDAAVRQQRGDMLHLPHIAPLTDYAAKLRERNLGEVPHFDPLDGGIDARVLFLFEKPGPMTSKIGKHAGSGFISRNNDDGTAAAILNFMQQAQIPRQLTVIWNLVPGWNDTRKMRAKELSDGAACVIELVDMLPALRAVVMVGKKAARVRPVLENRGLALFTSFHHRLW